MMKTQNFNFNAISKVGCLLLCCTFIIPVGSGPAWAEVVGTPVKTSQLLTTPSRISEILKELPSALGHVEESAMLSSRSVIVLQDAHASGSVQKNIELLVEFLQARGGIDLVGVEGSWNVLDGRLFRSYPKSDELRKVIDRYMTQGEVPGSVAAAIFSPSKSDYFGLEEKSLYETGIGLYLKAARQESKILTKIKIWEDGLETKKRETYSRDLLELDFAHQVFLSDPAQLLLLLKRLNALGALPADSEAGLLMKVSKDLGMTEKEEIEKSAGGIKKYLEKIQSKDSAEFQRKYQSYRISAISPAAFALFLKDVATKNHHELRFSGSLEDDISRERRLAVMRGEKFFNELESYVEVANNKLFRNDAERELDSEDRECRLIKRMAKLEIARSDWEKLKKILRASQNILHLMPDLQPAADFYQNAEKREAVFLKNLNARMLKQNSGSAILIAGGFHAAGVISKLKESKVSYFLIAPGMQSVPRENDYARQMEGDVSWKKDLQVHNKSVDLYHDFFNAVMPRLLAELSVRRDVLLKSWRDQIIRNLAKENLLTRAGDYTSMIDNIDFPESRLGWKARIEKFSQGLKQLKTRRELNVENVAALFNPASSSFIVAPAAGPLILSPRSELRAEFIPALGNPAENILRKELRMDMPFERLDSLGISQKIGLDLESVLHIPDKKERFPSNIGWIAQDLTMNEKVHFWPERLDYLPKVILRDPPNHVYQRRPWETPPMGTENSILNQRRSEVIKTAVDSFVYLAEAFKNEEQMSRAHQIEESVTVLGVDVPTNFLFYDSPTGLGYLYYFDRQRGILYFSLPFLAALQEKGFDFYWLTLLLDEAVQEHPYQGSIPYFGGLFQESVPDLRHVNLTIARRDPKSKLYRHITERIFDFRNREEDNREKSILPQIKDLQSQIQKLQMQMKTRENYSDLERSLGYLASLEEMMGWHDQFQETYKAQVNAMRELQKVDEGLLPLQIEEKICWILLRTEQYNSFLKEIEAFLQEKIPSRDLREDEKETLHSTVLHPRMLMRMEEKYLTVLRMRHQAFAGSNKQRLEKIIAQVQGFFSEAMSRAELRPETNVSGTAGKVDYRKLIFPGQEKSLKLEVSNPAGRSELRNEVVFEDGPLRVDSWDLFTKIVRSWTQKAEGIQRVKLPDGTMWGIPSEFSFLGSSLASQLKARLSVKGHIKPPFRMSLIRMPLLANHRDTFGTMIVIAPASARAELRTEKDKLPQYRGRNQERSEFRTVSKDINSEKLTEMKNSPSENGEVRHELRVENDLGDEMEEYISRRRALQLVPLPPRIHYQYYKKGENRALAHRTGRFITPPTILAVEAAGKTIYSTTGLARSGESSFILIDKMKSNEEIVTENCISCVGTGVEGSTQSGELNGVAHLLSLDNQPETFLRDGEELLRTLKGWPEPIKRLKIIFYYSSRYADARFIQDLEKLKRDFRQTLPYVSFLPDQTQSTTYSTSLLVTTRGVHIVHGDKEVPSSKVRKKSILWNLPSPIFNPSWDLPVRYTNILPEFFANADFLRIMTEEERIESEMARQGRERFSLQEIDNIIYSDERKMAAARIEAGKAFSEYQKILSQSKNARVFAAFTKDFEGKEIPAGFSIFLSGYDMEHVFWPAHPQSQLGYAITPWELIDREYADLKPADQDYYAVYTVVRPISQNQGIGTALKKYALAELANEGAKVIRGSTRKYSKLIYESSLSSGRPTFSGFPVYLNKMINRGRVSYAISLRRRGSDNENNAIDINKPRAELRSMSNSNRVEPSRAKILQSITESIFFLREHLWEHPDKELLPFANPEMAATLRDALTAATSTQGKLVLAVLAEKIARGNVNKRDDTLMGGEKDYMQESFNVLTGWDENRLLIALEKAFEHLLMQYRVYRKNRHQPMNDFPASLEFRITDQGDLEVNSRDSGHPLLKLKMSPDESFLADWMKRSFNHVKSVTLRFDSEIDIASNQKVGEALAKTLVEFYSAWVRQDIAALDKLPKVAEHTYSFESIPQELKGADLPPSQHVFVLKRAELRAVTDKIRISPKEFKNSPRYSPVSNLFDLMFIAKAVANENPDANERRVAAAKTVAFVEAKQMPVDAFLIQVGDMVRNFQTISSPREPYREQYISQSVFDSESAKLLGFLKSFLSESPDRKFRMVLDLPAEGTGLIQDEKTRNYLSAIRQVSVHLDHLILHGKLTGKSADELTLLLRKELKIPYGQIQRWSEIQPLDNAILPAISSKTQFEGESPALFFLGIRSEENRNDPRIEGYAALLQFVFAIVAASKVKNLSELKNKTTQTELLNAMTLFKQYSDSSELVQFLPNGQVLVSLRAVEAYLLLSAQAEASLARSA